MKRTLIHALLLAFILHPPSFTLAQGSLTPPGAPAPTMKSLDQIDTHIGQAGDKRIDVLTLSGDGSNQYVIATSGSYYLSGNITGPGAKNGINITASGVTLDLNGFTVDGTGGTGGAHDGILAAGDNVIIHNGTVQKWTGNGINCLGGSYTLRNLHCLNNTGSGILGTENLPPLGSLSGYLISNCLLFNNGALGIWITFGSATIEGCSAIKNGGTGIYAGGFGNTVTNCVAYNNTGGSTVDGIDADVVTGCNAQYNAGVGINGRVIANSYASGNTVAGFSVGSFGSLTNSTAYSNAGDGVKSANNCSILNNNASQNGSGSTGDGFKFSGGCLVIGNTSTANHGNGFHVTGTGASALNRIDGNMAVSNGGAGILWANDFVARNVSLANTPNYSPAVGNNNTGPVQAAGSATNPFANF